MRTVQDILGRQNVITGLLENQTITPYTLIGDMGNVKATPGTGTIVAFAGRITLKINGWVKMNNEYIYQYRNSKLKGKYFLQITPLIEGADNIEKFYKMGIKSYITTEDDSDVYIFYATNQPTITFDVMIVATKVDDISNEEEENG